MPRKDRFSPCTARNSLIPLVSSQPATGSFRKRNKTLAATLAIVLGAGLFLSGGEMSARATGEVTLPISRASQPAAWQETAQVNSFDGWVQEFRKEALGKGIEAALFDRAFQGIRPSDRVIELDRGQPESKWTFAQYLEKVVNPTRIKQGQQKYQQHYAELKTIGDKIGVQPRFIVALWGIETNFGKFTGGFSVVQALATLAYDGRRSEYFRKELMNAMTILNEGHITPEQMKGSWAGAMGQCQFMPSSFLRYALDYNGDGHKDIWNTRSDIFASIANYLASVGWNNDQTWGRRIKLPRGFNMALADHKNVWKPLAQWDRLGIRRPDGSAIPVVSGMKAAVIAPDGRNGPAFLVYENFNHVMKWNRSTYFATAVGLLADAIAAK